MLFRSKLEDLTTEGQNLDIFGKPSLTRVTPEEAVTEEPSQGGSANLMIQEAMRNAENQTEIEQANRERQRLFGTPEGELADAEGLEKREKEAKARAEGLALYEQRVAEQEGGQRTIPGIEPMVTQPKVEQTQEVSKTPIERASDYLKSLNQRFGNPSQVKNALKNTEFKNQKADDVFKEYNIQSSLFEQEPAARKTGKQSAEQKTADIQSGVVPEKIDTNYLSQIGIDKSSAIYKRVASQPEKYTANNTEGLKDLVSSFKKIADKKQIGRAHV